jgi:oxygen-independent coproporphyrinogen III oxidase
MENPADTDCEVTRLPDIIEQPYGLYPSIETFSSDYTEDDYREWVVQSNGEPLPAPLSVYIQDNLYRESRLHSAAAIQRELLIQGHLIESDRPMQQLFLSGSMLTAYSDDQLYQLIENVRDAFAVDPENLPDWCASSGATLLSPARLRLLKILGVNGVRFTCQTGGSSLTNLKDLIATVRAARDIGIQTVTVDLPAGSQYQADSSGLFETLLKQASRVRLMAEAGLERVRIIDMLYKCDLQPLSAGWYVRADDCWLRARAEGRLFWSLLGYSEMHSPDIIGIGPGAVSAVGECYSANSSVRSCYQASIGKGELPMVSGLELEADDSLRREIMGMILAAGVIRVSYIEGKWGIRFEHFFAPEKSELDELEGRGWVKWQDGNIVICTQDHQELSALCRLFDRRARAAEPDQANADARSL